MPDIPTPGAAYAGAPERSTGTTDTAIHLAVALDGAGWHPQAWRHPSAAPTQLFTQQYWSGLAQTAERGLLDLITIEDSFSLQSSTWGAVDDRTDQVRGRLDAVLIASMVGPLTSHIGVVPTHNVTHTEPFHIASAISTLDYASRGRGGWRPQVSGRADEAAHVGRRTIPSLDLRRRDDPAAIELANDLFDEATDAVEVVRRLWDSWEDDAVIKDVATGRYIDREKLHYIDFSGRFFSVKGPSIVPRPPQGQPLVASLAHSRLPIEFAVRSADVVFITPPATSDVADRVAQVRATEAEIGRDGAPLRIFADLVVFLDDQPGGAAARLAELDGWNGSPFVSDAAVFAGTPQTLAAELETWHALGIEGFRLRPGVIGHDLDAIVDGVVPALQQRGLFRSAYAHDTLRARLGLPRPVSRYAATGAA